MPQFSKIKMIALLIVLTYVQSMCQANHAIDFSGNRKPANTGVPIVIGFDDNFIDEWYRIKDTLKFYGVKCTFFVSGFSRLNRREVEELKTLQSECHEIACHSRTHADAESYSNKYGIDKYIEREIMPEIKAMAKAGIHPVSFAYPNGSRNMKLDRALEDYFKILRGVTLYPRPVFNQFPVVNGLGMDDNFFSIDYIFQELERNYNKGQFVILIGHTPTVKPFTYPRYYTTIDRLIKIIKKAKTLGFRFCKTSELGPFADGKQIASRTN
ncbi:MAG TPA: polysaccharide deacetylase family protein [Ignavibacteriales bacterium]|nr:polysaccharide deacetylase family protein [Ignavibacteriales bacterium]